MIPSRCASGNEFCHHEVVLCRDFEGKKHLFRSSDLTWNFSIGINRSFQVVWLLKVCIAHYLCGEQLVCSAEKLITGSEAVVSFCLSDNVWYGFLPFLSYLRHEGRTKGAAATSCLNRYLLLRFVNALLRACHKRKDCLPGNYCQLVEWQICYNPFQETIVEWQICYPITSFTKQDNAFKLKRLQDIS